MLGLHRLNSVRLYYIGFDHVGIHGIDNVRYSRFCGVFIGYNDVFGNASEQSCHNEIINVVRSKRANRKRIALFQTEFFGNTHADIRAVVAESKLFVVVVDESYFVARNIVNIERNGLSFHLNADRTAEVAFVFVYYFSFLFVGSRFGKEYPRRIIKPVVIINIQKRIHRVFHSQRSENQNRTADNAYKAHSRSRFVPYDITHIPARAERKFMKEFGFFYQHRLDFFRRVRTKSVGGGACKHFSY